MFTSLTSRLSAPFAPDGSHLQSFLQRKAFVTQGLWEEIILHDHIFIPTPDYLTASGLVLMLGEKGFIDLLERGKITFIRTTGIYGFMQGEDRKGGIVNFSRSNNNPQDSPIDASITAGLSVIENMTKEKNKLFSLILENSKEISTPTILKIVTNETINDFQQSPFWRSNYRTDNPHLLNLPQLSPLSVKVFNSASSPDSLPVDRLLAYLAHNIDLYLASAFGCQNSRSIYSASEILKPKQSRLRSAGVKASRMRAFFELNDVPDISQLDLNSGDDLFRRLLDLSDKSSTKQFRRWFHENGHLSDTNIAKEYISQLKSNSVIQSLPSKIVRFAFTTTIGAIPGVNAMLNIAAGIFDSFIIESLFKKDSPRLFVDELSSLAKDAIIKRGTPG